MANNASFITKYLELQDRQDQSAVMELVAPNARAHVGGHQLDRAGWWALGATFYAAFPDAKHVIQRVIDGGDHVTVICTFGGTHKGELMGIPPTGRAVSTDVIMVYRLAEGRIIEHFGQFDSAGFMQQLASPTPDLVGRASEWYRTIDATKDLNKVLTLATSDVTFRMGGQSLDRAGYVAMGGMFFAAFPDGQHTNDELVPIGADRVLVKGTFTGTHTGTALHGIPPAGKKIAATYMSVLTFAADGRVRAYEGQFDAAGLMQQLA